ncbi:hypothetical protein LT337_31995 (plasmid) [Mycolicibacterium fortuitum]|uniref:hypothetical protein n=1 Tax=Mycolicibacterium conceptionense TaxID=451644 RepID=UPI003204752F|nr:hypothetical protein LT337_31995 [Mycolicibacterium fortuitum]
MPRSTSKKAQYQAAADKAIRDQLAQRKALVGAIGTAEEKYEQQQKTVADAQQQLEVLANEVADAYNNAIEGGWTAAELKGLGISRPDAKPTKAKSSSSKAANSADNSGSSHNPQTTDNSDSEAPADTEPASATPDPHLDPMPSYQ